MSTDDSAAWWRSCWTPFTDPNFFRRPRSLTSGYHDSQYGDIAQQILIPGLTKALAIQPLSTALTGVAVVAAGLHLCTNFIFWPFLCALAAVCSIVCFVIEIVSRREQRYGRTMSGWEG